MSIHRLFCKIFEYCHDWQYLSGFSDLRNPLFHRAQKNVLGICQDLLLLAQLRWNCANLFEFMNAQHLWFLCHLSLNQMGRSLHSVHFDKNRCAKTTKPINQVKDKANQVCSAWNSAMRKHFWVKKKYSIHSFCHFEAFPQCVCLWRKMWGPTK